MFLALSAPSVAYQRNNSFRSASPARQLNHKFGISISKAKAGLPELAVDTLREVIARAAKSITALGNSANAFFAQMSATLAMDQGSVKLESCFRPATVSRCPSGRCSRLLILLGTDPFRSPFRTTGFGQPNLDPFAMISASFEMFSRFYGGSAFGSPQLRSPYR